MTNFRDLPSIGQKYLPGSALRILSYIHDGAALCRYKKTKYKIREYCIEIRDFPQFASNIERNS